MKTKSAFAIFLCFVIMLGACLGYSKKEYVEYSNAHVLSGYDEEILKEEYQDKITLKLMASCSSTLNSDWSQNKFFKRMNKLTGVNFNFDNVFLEGMYKQKKPLAFTSEETMPDVFFKAFFTSQDEITYGANKQIIPLNKLIDEYAPNIKNILEENPIIRRCITTPDGNIYALPTMYLNTPNDGIMRGFWWVNKQWLKDVGEVDENGNYVLPSTVEDLYRVLKKFKEQKCSDKNAYPLVICGSTELFSLFPIFGLDFSQYFVQADGNDTVIFGPQTDNFYNALQWLHKFFEEGLINQDWNTFTESKRYSYAQKDMYGMYMTSSPLYVSGAKRIEQFVTLDPLTSELHQDAFWSAMCPVERGCFAITSTCQYPELAIKWIDILYNTENPYWIWAINGEEGREWEWVDTTHQQWRSRISSAEYAERMKDTIVQPGDGMPYAVDEKFFDKEVTNNADYVRQQRNRQMAKGKINYPMVYISKDDLRTFSLLSTNINYAQNKREYEQEERKEFRNRIFEAVQKNVLQPSERSLGVYQGFEIVLPSYMLAEKPYVWLKGEGKYYVELGEADRGVLIRIDNFLGNLKMLSLRFMDTLTDLTAERERMRQELDRQESYAEKIEELKEELKRLDKKLGVK